MIQFVRALVVFAFLLVGRFAYAQEPDAVQVKVPGAELTVSVLTIGPGDHPFYKFGHNAILIHDAERKSDEVYNFGSFDYHSPTLIFDFLRGRLVYWLSVDDLDLTVAYYHGENRSISAQELALTPAERSELQNRLRLNALPENRNYHYDYYKDNCSTRVRDIVDTVTQGKLRSASSAPAAMTLRAHTNRLTADSLAVYLGLDVAMGARIDQPITRWEEMFLPSMLERSLRSASRPGAAEGALVPLVAKETVLLSADRAPVRAEAPQRLIAMGLVGLASGAALAALGRKRKQRLARVAYALLTMAISVVTGLLGSIFAFFWLATDHVVAHRNENLLLCSPLALALAVACVGLLRGKPAAEGRVRNLTAALAVCAVLAILFKLLPWSLQANGPFLALLVPVWLGAALGARKLPQHPAIASQLPKGP
jgi:Domain of unknown function (DUF4105)